MDNRPKPSIENSIAFRYKIFNFRISTNIFR
jgi:hypothetical protein